LTTKLAVGYSFPINKAMTPKKESSQYRPEVILDFSIEEGMLTVSLKNIGRASAYVIKTEFDKPFYGLNGEKCISRMRLFRRLDFMAPGKEFCQFVDILANYAKRKEPMRIKATVSYRDRDGNRYVETMPHDLRIYLELGQVKLSKRREGG
jgi:hypothetical protein